MSTIVRVTKVRTKRDIINHPAVDSVSDERDNGDGWFIYLKEGWINYELECGIIHEQTITECIKVFNSCVIPKVIPE